MTWRPGWAVRRGNRGLPSVTAAPTHEGTGGSIMFMRAVHPGIVIKDELDEFGITPTEFSRQIKVPPNRVSQIIAGKRSITGDTALRFGHWFGIDPQFWLNLQAQFDLLHADRETGDSIRQLPTKDALPPRDASPRLV